MAKVAQGIAQTGGAVGVRPHQAALAGLAAIHRCTDENAMLCRHGFILVVVFTGAYPVDMAIDKPMKCPY
ncbi:hypothetical protein [Sulfitobacter sediminilitoris]|uniref:hypothetical protein n=1 Tax=Sulfitobacter sediminilitoris TaxID=2698830 RepID=UPI0036161B39